jgi:hypothetical protein
LAELKRKLDQGVSLEHLVGTISIGRVMGTLSVSRAIGDVAFKGEWQAGFV